jgi:hypothetical protein
MPQTEGEAMLKELKETIISIESKLEAIRGYL